MIKEGSKVKVHYTGKFEDGSVFDSSVDNQPLEFVVGEGTLIQGFEKGILGLNVGDKKTIELDSEEAYGPVRDELVSVIPKENVPDDVAVGLHLQAQTEQGPINVIVTEINENTVKVDANHPLAGKKLIFDIDVVELN